MTEKYRSFSLPVTPVAKGRPRFSRNGHAYTPAKTRTFEAEVRKMLMLFKMPAPMEGPLWVSMRFIMPTPKRCPRKHPSVRPDIDNLMKGVKDAANGILWNDDAQICELKAVKLYDQSGGKPRIEIMMGAL
jgi:Holliday junction resolvase RusA-like endonuclease